MLICAQYFLKFSGSISDHNTVKFGSGLLPRLISVWKIAERSFSNEAFPGIQHSPDAFRYPGGISCEDLIVARRTQMPYQTQLCNELIHQFLRLRFRKRILAEISFQINIQKGGGSPRNSLRRRYFP